MGNLKVALAAACAVVIGWRFTASADGGSPAYEFLEYASTPGGTGSPRINTEIVPATTMEFRFKYAMDENNGYRGVFGSYAAEDTQSTRIICNNGNAKQVLVYFMSTAGGGGTVMSMATGSGEVIEGYMNLTSAKLNAVSATLSRRVGKACTVPMHVFAAGPTSAGAKSRFWYFSALDDGVYTRHYLPCRRTADGVVGFWDAVSKSFVEPTGGALTAGPVYAGYRLDANEVCQFGVVATVKGKGTVKADGGAAGATASAWTDMFAAGATSFSTLTTTLTATPDEGWRFICWAGDVSGLTAAEKCSPTLTVTTDKAMSLTAVFMFDLPASAYQQDGLIAQWDGIENARRGQPHDPNATVWSNLVSGTTYNWSLVSGKYVWERDAVNAKSSLSTTGWLATMTGVKSIGYTTFETYVQPEAGLAKTTGSFFRQATRKGNVFLMPGNVSGYLTSGQKGANLGFVLGDRFSTTLVYNNDGSAMSAVYKDGVAQTLTTPTYGWAVKDQNMSIGGISASDTDYVFKGRIHTIRLYNRQLTAAEAACNANIDKIRFDGADPSELDWPADYRFNAEKARIETLLDLSGAEGATVSFDNETFETATNGWFALNEPVTVYAKPVAGQSIAAWTGLPDGAQVSDDKTTATFTLTGPMSVSAVSHAPMTLRWRGGASAFASDVANWAKDDGSAAAIPPVSGDAVHFDKDSPSMTWDLDEVTLASWTQDEDFTGTNTFQTGPVHEGVDSPTRGVLSADGKRRELIVTGDITLNGGRWHQADTPSLAKTHPGWTTGEGVYRLIARAGGNFTVGAKAVVEANLSGFRKEQGPGKTGSRGATHGGSDNGYYAGNTASPETNHYGSVRHPVTQGSGAVYSVGGGALELSADGTFALDGALEADGGSYRYYTGSGGSVFVTAATLTGTGHVYACGYCTEASAGAGGRLAFVVTGPGATFDGFTATLRCYGNSGHCNPGTIYWETPNDRANGGVLEIRGRNSLSVDNRGYYTMLVDTGEDFTFDTVVLTNKVKFAIGPGVTLKANRIISNTTNNRLVLLGGKLVVPDGYALTNVILRNDYYPSAVGTPAGATGTNLLAKGATFTIDRRIDFDGTFRMLSGAKVNHTAAGNSDADLFRADFTAREFVLDSGATVDLTARGYPAAAGPGKPTDDGKTSRGGSHGGLAHDVGSVQTYGSVTRPVTLGSGGLNGIGGGATHIVVSGRSVIDGTIAANGQANSRSGAGGSVWLETGTLEGASTGVISADGGKGSDGYEFYAGAGGRVAVTLTEPGADFSQYQGAIRAKGAVANVTVNKVKTYYAAGNGTVYLRKGGERENEGTLIVDGDATCVNDDNFTDITMDVTENTVGHVVVTNGGNLRVRKGARLDVRQSFANRSVHQGDRVNGEPGDDTLAAGAVAFVDKTVEATVTGTNAFMRLLADEPGKTIRFGAAADSLAKIDPLGSFDVAGTAETPVFLRGLMDGTPWLLELRGKANLAYADVKDSDATPGDKVAVDDTNVNSGNNRNWGFITVTPGETITWNGSKGASFATADNWDLGRPPVDTDVIVIPADAAEMPVLMDVFVANRLTVAAGATLGLNGFSLTVTNGLDCAGALVCSGAETLTLAGDVTIKSFTAADSTVVLAGGANRTVDFAGQALRTLEIAGTAGQTTFADGFAADFITCLRTDAASTLVFAAGKTVTVGQIKLKGALTDVLPGMTLASSEPGAKWKLNVTGKADVTGVIVTDSDASAGKRVAAFNPSEDGKNNVNWLFGVTQSAWIGPAAGGNWSDAANWADGKIPDKDTRVVFDADATVTIDKPDAVAMQLEVDGATLTVKGTETLRVTTLLEILAGGTLTQNTAGNSIHVEGSAYVRAGGAWTHASNGATDQGFGINATVDGDFTIDAGGKVDAYKKGFNAHKGWATQQQASHGARFNSTSKPCYGSMFRPTDIGSGGGWDGGHAGGRVYLTVKGTLTANGEIDASSMIEDWYPGSGGSILLECGRLAGNGLIRAQGGSRSNADNNAGCGGRVALYLENETDLSGFSGTIQAYGGVNNHTAGSLPIASCGTFYLQAKGVEDGCGTVYVNNGGGITTSGGVDLPVTNRCDDLVKCYKNVTFDVAEGGTLFVTGDVTVNELELGTKSRVNLNGHTLTIRSHAHKKGKGWPANWQTGIVYAGTDAKGNPGKVVWEPWGLMIMVR